MNLKGKAAIVTGGGTGIGRAIATRLARDGAMVAIDYVGKSDKADAVVLELQKMGGRVIAIEADVSNVQQVEKLVQQVVAQFGRLDILVNNAGIEHEYPFLRRPPRSGTRSLPSTSRVRPFAARLRQSRWSRKAEVAESSTCRPSTKTWQCRPTARIAPRKAGCGC